MAEPLADVLTAGAAESGALDRNPLPIFPGAVTMRTTADSSPYMMPLDAFRLRYGGTTHRRALLTGIDDLLTGAGAIGVDVSALLIGGSFLDRRRAEPRDIDCLAYYGIGKTEEVDTTITAWKKLCAESSLDVKLCPVDVGPLAIIKRSIFFSNIFGLDKKSLILERGVVLIALGD